jgi:Zinc dependent phospholipase C
VNVTTFLIRPRRATPSNGFVWFAKACLVILVLLALAAHCDAYGVLSHEALIDSAWDDTIKPLLLARFPNATPEELKTAHGYAYGGAVIQDMGYYPFGSKLFSDLTHYVRTADFVRALIGDSQDLNDYAFALGALAHYVADNDGHRLGVNVSVPLLYPKLQRKYGNVVVYDENPLAHLKTEFGFDVLQVAKHRYAPDDYRDRIGFEVAKPLLAKAFEETYGLKLESIFSDYDLAIATYRSSVSSLIPRATKVAWQVKKDEIQRDSPGITRKEFLYHLSRASYRKQWHEPHQEPGFGTKLLAFLFRLVPKIGPFRVFAFRTPTPETEKLFMTSFNAAVTDYERFDDHGQLSGLPQLENKNFDTGTVTGPGQYPLADKTYADLLDRLAKDHFAQVSPDLRRALLDYYSDPNAPFATKKNKKEWAKVTQEVDELKNSNIPQTAVQAGAGR